MAAETWSWASETVDTSGAFTSLAIDNDDNVHLSYTVSEQIKYSFRPARDSKWYTMRVDRGNSYTNITLDKKGSPAICFTAYGQLKFAQWQDDRWVIQQIAPNAGLIGFSCSVRISADGIPSVSWYQVESGGNDFYHIRYAFRTDGVWKAHTVDYGPETGKWNSLQLDVEGKPRLTYSCFECGDLKYSSWNGKEWVIDKVDGGDLAKGLHLGPGNSLVLGADGSPRISYEDEKSVKFAKFVAGHWDIQQVDTILTRPSWLAFRTGLALDQEGNPHIVYQDSGALKHTYLDGSGWHVQVVTPSGSDYRYGAIAIDHHDTIYISYQDPADGSLKVAVGRARLAGHSITSERTSAETDRPLQNSLKR